MKARAFALMIIAVLIWAMAAAGIADDIDNCCFVDRQCSTDQDWTDGYWAFQNKQCPAPAPAQSAASSSAQPVSAAPDQIDNCCFVDRQCQTDQDWTAGYHAFQNKQCQAPAQSPASTSSQPVSAAPAQIDNIDNCCFVDRQCSNELEWEAGFYAYQNNQCAAPGQSSASAISPSDSGVILRTASGVVIGYRDGRGILPSTGPSILPALGEIVSTTNCCEYTWQCNNDQDWAAGYRALQSGDCSLPGLISIVGPPYFVDPWERALDLLRTRLPQRYNYVLDGVDKVEQHAAHGGAGINPLRRTFFVGQSNRLYHPRNMPVEEMSTVLVHEACHVHRANAGYLVRDGCSRIREEAFCVDMQVDVFIELNVEPSLIETYRNLAADIRSREYNVLFEGEEC